MQILQSKLKLLTSVFIFAVVIAIIFIFTQKTSSVPASDNQYQINVPLTINTDETVPTYPENVDTKDLAFELGSMVRSASVPDEWKSISRKDLGINFKLPEDIAYNSQFLHYSNGFGTISLTDDYLWHFHKEDNNINRTHTPSGLLLRASENPDNKDEYFIAELELPYYISNSFLLFEFAKKDMLIVASIIKSIEVSVKPDPASYKSYVNKDLGFEIKFPINKSSRYELSESFTPTSKGYFSVFLKSGHEIESYGNGLSVFSAGKDYTCECDAGIKQVNREYPKNSTYYPVEYFVNPNGVEYAVISSKFRAEDDDLGEGLHVGEKIYVLKTKNKDFTVMNIVTQGAMDEAVAKYMVDSFELI